MIDSVVFYSDVAHMLLSRNDGVQISICLPHWQQFSKTGTHLIVSCQSIVNLIGRARSDIFEDPRKFSHSSLGSLALTSELIMEKQQNVTGTQEIVSGFKR
jgi:hypothetical protein